MIFMPCDTTTSFNCPAEAAPKMLTQQLRELENDHLIGRTVYPVVPPKTEYYLTDFGKSVIPVLDAMCDWGRDYISKK